MMPFGELYRRLAAATAGVAVLACTRSAGENASERAAAADPRGDIFAVLPATGPNPALGHHGDLFGRFVGTWDADYAFIAADGSVLRQRGEVLFGWVMDGYAIQDIFLSYPDSAGGVRKMVGGLRYVDPRTDRWTVMFVAPSFHAAVRMEGGADGDRIVLRGRDSDGNELRWSFNEIQPDSFIWRGETSHDGGRTWRMDEEHHMRRRGPARAG
jgi:hypothetical protein